MHKDIINQIIAEACGWIPKKSWKLEGRIKKDFHWEHSVTKERIFNIPNYYEDLNAIHEAEKILTTEQRDEFVDELVQIIAELKPTLPIDGYYEAVFIDAPQRCEALLRTIGKWVETKGEGE